MSSGRLCVCVCLKSKNCLKYGGNFCSNINKLIRGFTKLYRYHDRKASTVITLRRSLRPWPIVHHISLCFGKADSFLGIFVYGTQKRSHLTTAKCCGHDRALNTKTMFFVRFSSLNSIVRHDNLFSRVKLCFICYVNMAIKMLCSFFLFTYTIFIYYVVHFVWIESCSNMFQFHSF